MMLFAEVSVLNKSRQIIDEGKKWQMFSPYCWIVYGFIIIILNLEFIYLVISEDNPLFMLCYSEEFIASVAPRLFWVSLPPTVSSSSLPPPFPAAL